MRLFEIFVSLLILICLFLENKKVKNSFFIYTLIPLLFLHFFIEGIRWQLIFIYLISLYLILIGIFRHFNLKILTMNKIISAIFIAFIAVSFALGYLFPIFKLQKPTGKYNVGITKAIYENPKRDIFFNKEGNKNIGITIWYPIDNVNNNKPVEYSTNSNLYSKWIGKSLGIPQFIFSHFNLIQTNSYLDFEISKIEKDYPVIIYSHALFSIANQNTILMEELASHGYIVISISHTYESAIMFLNETDYISYDENFMKEFYSNLQNDYPLFKQRFESKDPLERKKIAQKIVEKSLLSNNLVNLRVEDINFIIDKIYGNNLNINYLKDSIDKKNIGVIGHSLGGATAYISMIENNLITSGVNIDGNQYGSYKNSKCNKPFLFMTTDFDSEFNDFLYEKQKYIKIIFSNTEHFDFSDIVEFSPLFKLIGFTRNTTIHKYMNSYILSFFNSMLKKENPLKFEPINDTIKIEYNNY